MFETMVRFKFSLKGSMTKILIPRFVPILKEVATCETHSSLKLGTREQCHGWVGLLITKIQHYHSGSFLEGQSANPSGVTSHIKDVLMKQGRLSICWLIKSHAHAKLYIIQRHKNKNESYFSRFTHSFKIFLKKKPSPVKPPNRENLIGYIWESRRDKIETFPM